MRAACSRPPLASPTVSSEAARRRVAARRAVLRRQSCLVAAMSSLSTSDLYLGLDVGTQSTKVLVYDPELREVLGRGSISYSVTRDRPGQAEQDPAIWVEVSAAAQRAGRLACCGSVQWLPAAAAAVAAAALLRHGPPLACTCS